MHLRSCLFSLKPVCFSTWSQHPLLCSTEQTENLINFIQTLTDALKRQDMLLLPEWDVNRTKSHTEHIQEHMYVGTTPSAVLWIATSASAVYQANAQSVCLSVADFLQASVLLSK